MISVIVPAHDEEKVIQRCLSALTRGALPGELEVIVVCNGCRDETAAVARSFGTPVRVLESGKPSKSHALNLGEELATGFPRFYVDADVLLPLESLRRVAEVLGEGRFLAAAPKLRVDLEGRPWAVRAYYAIWTRLPYHDSGMIGSGVYAVSEAGRRAFDSFPGLISDDGFVQHRFRPEERTTVDSAWFQIAAPDRLGKLVHIKVRSQKGALQLRRAYPERLRSEPRDYRGALGRILRSPRLWPCLVVYCYVMAIARANAYWQYYVSGLEGWERDESSRQIAGSEPPELGPAPRKPAD